MAPALTRAQLFQRSPSDREAQLRPNGDGYPEITTENDRYCRHSVLNGPITVRPSLYALSPSIWILTIH